MVGSQLVWVRLGAMCHLTEEYGVLLTVWMDLRAGQWGGQ